jgi:cell division septum initiation protein DivIVA
MLEDLDTLEAKLTQLLDHHQNLRAENTRLRQELVTMGNANKLLTERLAEVRGRMESLFDKLPE